MRSRFEGPSEHLLRPIPTPAEEPEHLPAHFFFMVFGIILAIHHPVSAHGRLMFCFAGEKWGDILLYCH
jgi:hypothetical protein